MDMKCVNIQHPVFLLHTNNHNVEEILNRISGVSFLYNADVKIVVGITANFWTSNFPKTQLLPWWDPHCTRLFFDVIEHKCIGRLINVLSCGAMKNY